MVVSLEAFVIIVMIVATVLICQVQQKSDPLKLFAVFSATAWNFSVKFSVFM